MGMNNDDQKGNNLVQFTDHQTQKLQADTANQSSVAGNPHSPTDANPNDLTPLHKIEQILGEGVHVIEKEVKDIEYQAEDLVSDFAGSNSLATGRGRDTDDSEFTRQMTEREQKKQHLLEEEEKKAA